jgi:hypothetical protein
MDIEGVLFSVARIALNHNFNVLHTYIHTICIILKLKVKEIGMRRRQRKNLIKTHGTTNQKFLVSSFKLQQAYDSKHHFIFINSIQAKHLIQIPHHWISATSNHHTLQWRRLKSQMHSVNMSPKRRTCRSFQCDLRSNMPGLRRVLPCTETSNHSDQLRQSLSPYTLIIARWGPHAHLSHRNVCRSKSFQLYSHGLQLHKHTNAHHLYRGQPIQDKTTKTKPQSLPLVPELLVILTKNE